LNVAGLEHYKNINDVIEIGLGFGLGNLIVDTVQWLGARKAVKRAEREEAKEALELQALKENQARIDHPEVFTSQDFKDLSEHVQAHAQAQAKSDLQSPSSQASFGFKNKTTPKKTQVKDIKDMSEQEQNEFLKNTASQVSKKLARLTLLAGIGLIWTRKVASELFVSDGHPWSQAVALFVLPIVAMKMSEMLLDYLVDRKKPSVESESPKSPKPKVG